MEARRAFDWQLACLNDVLLARSLHITLDELDAMPVMHLTAYIAYLEGGGQ